MGRGLRGMNYINHFMLALVDMGGFIGEVILGERGRTLMLAV